MRDFEDIFPSPEEIRWSFNKFGIVEGADAWLRSNDIDPDALKARGIACKTVPVSCSWDFDVSRGFDGEMVYQIEPGYQFVLGVPLIREGEMIDLLLIDPEDPTVYRTVAGRMDWLGEEQIGAEELRLHYSPFAWLEAGGVGVANLHPYCRQHFKDLAGCSQIFCDDIDIAMECWEWGFGARDEDLDRIVCDDDHENVKAYFERQAFWEASSKVRGNACRA